MAWYVARIANHDDAHAVTFPDAPAVCVTAAALEDAVVRATQALTWHFDALRAKGIFCPSATPLTAFDGSGVSTGVIYALVEVPDARGPSATRPLTQELLERAPISGSRQSAANT